MCLVPQFTDLLLSPPHGSKPLISSFTVLCSWEEEKKFINCVFYFDVQSGKQQLSGMMPQNVSIWRQRFYKACFPPEGDFMFSCAAMACTTEQVTEGDKQHLGKMFRLCPDHCKSENSFSLTLFEKTSPRSSQLDTCPFPPPSPLLSVPLCCLFIRFLAGNLLMR